MEGEHCRKCLTKRSEWSELSCYTIGKLRSIVAIALSVATPGMEKSTGDNIVDVAAGANS